MHKHNVSWAGAQTMRVHGPIYAVKAKRERDAKRRAKYDGREYRGPRRILRDDAKGLIFSIKLQCV